MSKRHLTALLTVIVAFVALSALLLRPSDEPYYNGKPLTYWLRGYDYPFYSGWQGPVPKELIFRSGKMADEAVRELGTNSIPAFCKLIEAQDSALRLRTRKFLMTSRFKSFFVRHGFLAPAPPAWFRHMEAFRALNVLGKNAESAVPSLIKLMEQTDNKAEREDAIMLLRRIGPGAKDAIPALIRIATNSPRVIGRAGSNPIPIFSDQALACYALADIHARAELTLPALMNCLHSPDFEVQAAAVHCMAALGKDAESAIPALVEIVKTNGRLSREASQALYNIKTESEDAARQPRDD